MTILPDDNEVVVSPARRHGPPLSDPSPEPEREPIRITEPEPVRRFEPPAAPGWPAMGQTNLAGEARTQGSNATDGIAMEGANRNSPATLCSGAGALDTCALIGIDGRLSAPAAEAPAPELLPYFRASTIARALGVSTKTIHRRAAAVGWPSRGVGNRREYAPPADVAVLCGPPQPEPEAAPAPPQVTYASLSLTSTGRALYCKRVAAVEHYKSLVVAGTGREAALLATVAHYRSLPPGESLPISVTTLRRWLAIERTVGSGGLVDQKQGRVGKKAVADALPEELRRRLQAKALEHGSVARGARVLMRDPRLPAEVREHLHEGHASKSYVTPSIRMVAKTAPLTGALAQGTRHARLQGRFTPASYDGCRAGSYFCGDDMTSNVLAWCEWPNARGYVIGQPQILPVIDVGSMRWLNVRVIMRSGGQYSSDDVWGLYGDVFDTFGLPEVGFVSEFGHWQAGKVAGWKDVSKSGITREERIGGLASLGLKVIPSFDPRTKIIETAFNQLQHVLDAAPGYAGRDQRKQLPETVKRWRAEAEAGHIHPRERFLHVSELANCVQSAMEQLNHERNDGEICRGASPLEKWTNDGADQRLRKIPDEAKWLYRSAVSVCQVTRNGLRITQGSGAKMQVYYYDNPALLTPRQGQKVSVYWNDHNPDADAVVLAGTPRKFLGLAARVQKLCRFTATPEQLDAEQARKKAAMQYSRTELRSIQPDMARFTPPTQTVPADASAVAIGRELATAAEKAEASATAAAQGRRVVQRAVAAAADADLSELTTAPRTTAPADGADDLAEMRELAAAPELPTKNDFSAFLDGDNPDQH